MRKPGRPPEGKTSSIRVDESVARKLHIIAAIRKAKVSDLTTPLLVPFVEKEYPKALKEAAADGSTP